SCLVEDAVRVDLQGNEAGRVTHDDAARARRLKARRPNKGAAQSAKGAPQQPKAEQQAEAAAAPQPAEAEAETKVQTDVAPQVEQQAAGNE
ncbi:ProQ/FinO family protein, partial [Rothia dentocariosa]